MSIEFRRILVMFAGIITTLITFALFNAFEGLDALRHYWMLVIPIPVGAFALGLLAGSGYGIAGWPLTRLKFTMGMLLFIAVSMAVAYGVLVGIEYARYAPDDVGFLAYFDQATRHSSMVSENPLYEAVEAEPLGPGGVLLSALRAGRSLLRGPLWLRRRSARRRLLGAQGAAAVVS